MALEVLGDSTMSFQTTSQGVGATDSQLPVQAARSGNYTVSAAECGSSGNGISNPIEILWPVGFVDTNYTCVFSVESIFSVKKPGNGIVVPSFFERMTDVQSGRSQGIIVVLDLNFNGSKPGDIFVIHAIAIHD